TAKGEATNSTNWTNFVRGIRAIRGEFLRNSLSRDPSEGSHVITFIERAACSRFVEQIMKAPRESGSKLPHSRYVTVFMKPCTEEESQMRGSQGFSLPEMMVSVLVLLMTLSAVF